MAVLLMPQLHKPWLQLLLRLLLPHATTLESVAPAAAADGGEASQPGAKDPADGGVEVKALHAKFIR